MVLEIYEGNVTIIPIITDKDISRKRKHGATSAIATYGGGGNAVDGRQLRAGDLAEPTQCRIEELLVRSSAFLYRESDISPPRVAFLYEDSCADVRVKVRELKFAEGVAELRPLDMFNETIDAGSSHLIPIPGSVGGMLVLGETSIRYMNDRTKRSFVRPLDEPTVFTCWEQIDESRWILGDDYCRLFFLMVEYDDSKKEVRGWKVDYLGISSHAAVMVHLGGGVVFIGSHQGDSQVIRITEGAFEVMQTFTNLAPILDFAVMDLGNRGDGHTMHEFSSGQARIVTGSGAFQDGSLRSVRSGVGIEELGILGEMEHATDLWGLRTKTTTPQKMLDTLVVSFVNETRVFDFSPTGEVEEQDTFYNFQLDQTTLFAANLPHDRFVQVTERGLRIAGNEQWQWEPSPGEAITAATANENYLVIVVNGTKLHAFSLAPDKMSEPRTYEFSENEQISGVNLSDELPTACIICHPQTATIRTVTFTGIEKELDISLGTPGDDVPRSVMVAQVLPNDAPSVFVAMADGSIISFNLDIKTYTPTKQNRILLSSEPASFKRLPRSSTTENGVFNVFATCEQPSLIYASEGRVVYSAADTEPGTRLCNFNTEAYPGSVAIATPNKLKLALVDSERTAQVHSLPVGETVYRTAYSQSERAFGIGSIKRELDAGVEIVTSHFILADEILFRKLSVYDLQPEELVSSVISFGLPNGQDALGKDVMKDVFAVGTAFADAAGTGESNGRILMFEVTENRELDLLLELPLKSSCRALAVMGENNDTLVVALIKSVAVYNISIDRFGDVHLMKVAAYRTSTAPTDIAVSGDIIAVADLMKSVSLVKYTPSTPSSRGTLVEIARHYQTVWSTCVAPVDKNTWLEGDAEGNLILLSRNINGVTAEDKRRMVVTGEFQLGEMVNKIRPVEVQTSPDAIVRPRAFMATVDGSIYMFGMVNPKYQDLLMRLQAHVSNIVTTPGGTSFNAFRSFRSKVRQGDEPFRFIDGGIVEMFLGLSVERQTKVVEAVNAAAELIQGEKVSVEKVVSMMEELKRMH